MSEDPAAPELRPLAGSERPAQPRATTALPIDPDQVIAVTMVLRRRAELPDDLAGPPLSREELAGRYGADPADLELVRQVMTDLGVTVVSSDAAARTVAISAPARVLERVFGTRLTQGSLVHPTTGQPVTYRQRTGGLSVPAPLHGTVIAVLGLDDRPQASARFRVAAGAAAQTSYTPLQLGKVYDFPAGTDGTGQTLAIIELGGGFAQSDLDAYFSGLGITGPTVKAVGVDGAVNVPGQDPTGADGEVLLDIEVAGALAPKASMLVYFAPNTDQGFLDAVNTAAHANPTPTAISISWGQSEDSWTAQARTAMDQAFADAAALGVTLTVAAGDDGSSDRATDALPHVDFPASSPHVLACGGTTLQANPTTGAVTSETVWDNPGHGATGGGVSDSFALPTWQAQAGVPGRAGAASGATGRGVPDVAGDADPATGYAVRVDGSAQVFGGTSAVAPLWAALVCRLAQAMGRRLGLLQPAIYSAASAGRVPPGFRDITSGNNGAYRAGPGWDACTGLGVPVGTALLTALGAAPVPAPGPAPSPGPAPGPAPSTPLRVVVMVQENHTTDNYFAGLRPYGANVATGWPASPNPPAHDQPHDRHAYYRWLTSGSAEHVQFDTARYLPYYAYLALTGAFFENHCSGFGTNSTGNHLLIVGGQSPTLKNPGRGSNPVWDLPSVPGHAADHGVDWRCYAGSSGYPFEFYSQLKGSPNILPSAQFAADARAGALPRLAFLYHDSPLDEHPPADVTKGAAAIQQAVDSVVAAGEWATTVFMLTWDDWGGYDDHVRTPNVEVTPDGVQLAYGPRVPLLMFGGPVMPGMDSRWCSHVSIAKTALQLLGLPPLGVARVDDDRGLADRVSPGTQHSGPPPAFGKTLALPPAPTPAPAPAPLPPAPVGSPAPTPPVRLRDGSTLPPPDDAPLKGAPKGWRAGHPAPYSAWSAGDHGAR